MPKNKPRRNASGTRKKPALLTVTIAGKKHRLDVKTAFSLAHQLVVQGNLESAGTVLSWIDRVLPDDRRVKVLQARREERLGNFAEGSKMISQAFPEYELGGDVSGPLHAAMVYRATGLFADARDDMREICAQYPEFPSLWLFAGDLWLAIGRDDKAVEAWKNAIKCDNEKPRVIASAARHRIAEIQSKRKSKQAKA